MRTDALTTLLADFAPARAPNPTLTPNLLLFLALPLSLWLPLSQTLNFGPGLRGRASAPPLGLSLKARRDCLREKTAP